jgi:hypothetical protein
MAGHCRAAFGRGTGTRLIRWTGLFWSSAAIKVLQKSKLADDSLLLFLKQLFVLLST